MNPIDHEIDGIYWVKVFLNRFNDDKTQRWKFNRGKFFSAYRGLALDINITNTAGGAEVGCTLNKKGLNQKWSLNSKEIIMFAIKGVQSGKALNVASDLRIVMWTYSGTDNQLRYWDKDSIRSKKYPEKVLSLDIVNFDSYGWTKVSLQTYDGGNNQIWNIDGDRVICDFQQYHLDVLHASQENGASVGGYQGNSNDNQKWIIVAAHASDKHISQSSCIDSTEEDIYIVVQCIPLVSSVWDLFSSIGYASAGCTSIAEERALSASIGLVMDVATVASGGATTGIKAGIKTGITYGMKQGMKATVRVTKQSVKQFLYLSIETVAENGLRKSLYTGIKKASKLLIQETFVDPAIFFKRILVKSVQKF